MISGDDAIAEEAKRHLGDIETAVVKWAYSFHSARVLTPEAANEVIGDTVRRALGRLAGFKPYKVQSPVRLEMSFKNYLPSLLLAYLPIVERVDSRVRYNAGTRDQVPGSSSS
jgi:D-amino peptidase